MVYWHNVKLIIMPVRLVEGKAAKCHMYWPLAGKEFSFTSFKVAMVKEEKLLNDLTSRTFQLTNHETGEVKEVKQLHYTGWPDHGVPDKAALQEFETMLNYFIEFMITTKSDERVIVHCSAGVGRTGTTIGLMTIIVNYFAQMNNGIKDPQIGIFSTVRRMREHRIILVQTFV